MRPTPAQNPETQDLDRQIKEYLANGGKIMQCPPQTHGEVFKDADWRKNKEAFTIGNR
jgi:hypothetical protein